LTVYILFPSSNALLDTLAFKARRPLPP
jgi:hypothetical protein